MTELYTGCLHQFGRNVEGENAKIIDNKRYTRYIESKQRKEIVNILEIAERGWLV